MSNAFIYFNQRSLSKTFSWVYLANVVFQSLCTKVVSSNRHKDTISFEN